MPPSRLAVILGPLIALVLIGGLVATVVQDPDRTELAQAPEPSEAPTTPASTAPAETASAAPTETATPAAAPVDQPGVGGQVAVEDPTALTGGWQGGTPNTGTAISGAGLLLLLVGGAMLWARRPRG
jgi:septal ring-binding cell division protein DamX